MPLPPTVATVPPTRDPPVAPPRARRWRWLLLAMGVALLAVALLYWGVPFVLGPQVRAVAVRRLEIVQTVVASGRVASPARISIGSQTTGEVVLVPVVEGQAVVATQLLVGLDEDGGRAGLEQAKAAVALASARIDQLHDLTLPVAEQALAQAEANRSNVQQQWTRTQQLVTDGFSSQADLDTAERSLRIANGEHETARLHLQAAQPGGTDDALAQGDLRQAQASLQVAQASLDHLQIRAPVDGRLIARSVERGDIVQPGKVLMELSPTGKTQLVVQIDEKNLRYLAIGQEALAAADAWPERRFRARLVYINPGVDASRGSVEIKLDVIDPPDVLRQDMTVSVDIEVARIAGALALPPQAVRDASGKSPWVMVIADGHAEHRAVQLGARGDSDVEVRSGLREGELVMLAEPAAMVVGSRVRALVES